MILQSAATLEAYFDMLPRKYGASRVNAYHILKSLTYTVGLYPSAEGRSIASQSALP